MNNKTFRDAFLSAVNSTGTTLPQVAVGTGISLDQLSALKQGTSQSVSVDSAVKISAFFGVPLEEFLGDPDLAHHVAIAQKYSRLPDALKAKYEAYGEGLLEPLDLPDPE